MEAAPALMLNLPMFEPTFAETVSRMRPGGPRHRRVGRRSTRGLIVPACLANTVSTSITTRISTPTTRRGTPKLTEMVKEVGAGTGAEVPCSPAPKSTLVAPNPPRHHLSDAMA